MSSRTRRTRLSTGYPTAYTSTGSGCRPGAPTRSPTTAASTSAPSASTSEQVAHLGVGRLREVVVPLAHGHEKRRRLHADHLVGDRLEVPHGGRCRDRHRDNDTRRLAVPPRLHCSAHRRAGGEAIVHEDHHSARDGDSVPFSAVLPLS